MGVMRVSLACFPGTRSEGSEVLVAAPGVRRQGASEAGELGHAGVPARLAELDRLERAQAVISVLL